MSARPWIAFDTETTGLPPRKSPNADNWTEWDKCRLVQLAWEIRGVGATPESIRKCYIIIPDGFTIPAEVVRIHGIDTERALAEGRPLAEVLAEFAEDIAQYDVKTVVAHNMSFDDGVIFAELYRADLKSILGLWTGLNKKCTMLMGARLQSGGKWPKLNVLYEKLCGPLPADTRLHNADIDTRLCADIYEKMLAD
jgi:DNA polymerase III epsilon subunit-like protein